MRASSKLGCVHLAKSNTQYLIVAIMCVCLPLYTLCINTCKGCERKHREVELHFLTLYSIDRVIEVKEHFSEYPCVVLPSFFLCVVCIGE